MKRTLKVLLLLLWMSLIFYFSAQPAAESTETSGLMAMFLYWLYRLFGLHGISETVFLETYMHLVRKAAHLIEFMVLGILVFMNCHEFMKKELLFRSLLFSCIYAVSDELHQLFVLNRSCQITDMLIDCLGACLGVFLCHAIYEWKK